MTGPFDPDTCTDCKPCANKYCVVLSKCRVNQGDTFDVTLKALSKGESILKEIVDSTTIKFYRGHYDPVSPSGGSLKVFVHQKVQPAAEQACYYRADYFAYTSASGDTLTGNFAKGESFDAGKAGVWFSDLLDTDTSETTDAGYFSCDVTGELELAIAYFPHGGASWSSGQLQVTGQYFKADSLGLYTRFAQINARSVAGSGRCGQRAVAVDGDIDERVGYWRSEVDQKYEYVEGGKPSWTAPYQQDGGTAAALINEVRSKIDGLASSCGLDTPEDLLGRNWTPGHPYYDYDTSPRLSVNCQSHWQESDFTRQYTAWIRRNPDQGNQYNIITEIDRAIDLLCGCQCGETFEFTLSDFPSPCTTLNANYTVTRFSGSCDYDGEDEMGMVYVYMQYKGQSWEITLEGPAMEEAVGTVPNVHGCPPSTGSYDITGTGACDGKSGKVTPT